MTIDSNDSATIREVLERLGTLYGLWSIQKHTGSLYEG